MSNKTKFALVLISGVLIATGFGLVVLAILSFFIEGIFDPNTIEQKGLIVLGGFLVGGIGLGLYVSNREEKKEKNENKDTS